MPRDITFGSDDPIAVLRQRVSTRERWSDDWEFRTEVHCTSAIFNASPSISEASVYYRYGVGRLSGDERFREFSPFTLPRLGFIRIEFEVYTESGEIEVGTWYGVVGAVVNRAEGGRVHWTDDPDNQNATPVPTGYQQFQCVGMDWLLDSHYVTTAVVNENGGTTVNSAPDFGQNFDSDSGTFARKTRHDEEAGPWSTRDTVLYLVEHATPADHNGDPIITWEVENDDLLPDWDDVRMQQHGFSVGSLLRRLISRHRGLGFYVDVRGNRATIVVFTFTERDIDLGDGNKICKNPIDELNLELSADRTGESTYVADSFSRADRIIVQGERATLTFSAMPVRISEVNYNGLLNDAAEGLDPNDTEARADLIARFSANPLIVRHASLYRLDVGDMTQIPIGGNLGGPLFRREYTFLQDKFILPSTRLRLGEDYSGDNVPDTDIPLADTADLYMRPICIGPDPIDDTRFLNYTAAAATPRDDKRSNVQLRPSTDSWMSIELNYPENLYSWINGFAGELISLLGNGLLSPGFDTVVTSTIEMDHYCEGIAEVGNIASLDIVREKFISVGGGRYRLDLLAKDTVVDVNPASGELVTHDANSLIRDDRERLNLIAKQAMSWYGAERLALRFSTNFISDTVILGAMVLTIVDGESEFEVNSPVTSITIESPIDTQQVTPPKIHYRTSFAELDVVAASSGGS